MASSSLQINEFFARLFARGIDTELHERVFAIPDHVPSRVGQNSFDHPIPFPSGG